MSVSKVISETHNDGHAAAKINKYPSKKRIRPTIPISNQYGERYAQFMNLIKDDKSKMKWLIDSANNQVKSRNIQECHDRITRRVLNETLSSGECDLKIISKKTSIYMELDKSNHEFLLEYYQSFNSVTKNQALQDLFYYVYLTLNDSSYEIDEDRRQSSSGVDILDSSPSNNNKDEDLNSVHATNSENNSDENSLVELSASRYKNNEEEEPNELVEEFFAARTGDEEIDYY